MDLASEIRGKMRIGFAGGVLLGISFLVADFIRVLNVENLDWIVGFAIFAGGWFLYDYASHDIPRIVAETGITKDSRRQESGHVRCQCGYEYEGKNIPQKCPQCEKPL